MKQQEPPKIPKPKKGEGYDKDGRDAPSREGGDDALSASPTDSRLDEKVIVNEQRSDKVVNSTSSSSGNDEGAAEEEIINQ